MTDSNAQLLGRAELMAQLARWAAERPDAVAMVDAYSAELTYGELWPSVCAVAGHLRDLGVRPGDRVGLPLRSNNAAIVTVLGATVAEAAPLLYDARATAKERDVLTAQAACVSTVEPLIVRGHHPAPAQTGHPDADWISMVTSGTNGMPKVVAKHWSAIVDNSVRFAEMAGYRRDDRILCTTPLHHAYAFGVAVIPALFTGATIVIAAHPPIPAAVGSLLADTGATIIQSVPFYYRAALEAVRTAPANRLRLGISAGEPLPDEVIARWQEATRAPLLNQYGATELGQIGLAQPGAPTGTVRLVPGVRARSRNLGVEGEILVTVPGWPCRYPGQPELERDSFVDGWFRTGDWGVVQPGRSIVVTGRTSRRIVAAGRKVDPIEVERVMRDLPAVSDCVVGVHEEMGYVGFLVADGGATELTIRRALARELSAYKIPCRLVLVPELPRTRTGKIRMGPLWLTAASRRQVAESVS